MRKYIALGTLFALGASASAVAEGFSYNLLEVGYVSNEIDDFNLEGNGSTLSGSFEFNERVFGFASLVDADYNHHSGVSTHAVSAGVGFAWPLGTGLDLVSGVAYEHLRPHVDGQGSANDEGYSLNAGLRSRVAQSLELTGGVKYTDLGHGLDDFTVVAVGC